MTTRVPKAIFDKPFYDYSLVLCPIWVGAIYIWLISVFPDYHVQIFAIYILFLGESHFAATWLFFNNRKNWDWLKQQPFGMGVIPAFIVVVFVAIGFWQLNLAFLLAAVASGFHVTRQSLGVYRLYGGVKDGINEALIYGFSFFFLIVGFFRFYAEDVLTWNIPIVTKGVINFSIDSETGVFLLVVTMFAVSILVKKYSNDWRQWTAAMTGILLYIPYCFVKTPYDAMAIGVGMHWCQYLGLNYLIYFKNGRSNSSEKIFGTKTALLFIALYTVIMSSLDTVGWKSFRSDQIWVLIPFTGQILHFYIDAFIWKFSDPHIRKEVGGPLFAGAAAKA